MSENSVCFLTYDWSFGTKPLEPNGCAWYRCVLPANELRNLGWEVGVGFPGYNDDHGFGLLIPDDKAIHGWDVIVLKLIMLKNIADKIEAAQNMGQKLVVDIDDWFEGLADTNLAYSLTDPKKNPENNRDHYMRIIDSADAIITSTPFLYDFYKNEKKMKNVFLVRNGIDVNRWTLKKDFRGRMPTLGWVGATPWRSNDLETMKPWFGNFLKQNRLEFHHSGSIKNANSAFDQLGIPREVKTSHEPMQPISKYPKLFRKMDIGIVPLNNIGFNHAKSTIKGLEYGASGVPFIASYSPEYDLLADMGVGRVASNEEEWLQHLEELLDPRIRKEDVERNIEGIKEHQSMQARGNDWNETMLAIKNL